MFNSSCRGPDACPSLRKLASARTVALPNCDGTTWQVATTAIWFQCEGLVFFWGFAKSKCSLQSLQESCVILCCANSGHQESDRKGLLLWFVFLWYLGAIWEPHGSHMGAIATCGEDIIPPG